LITVSRAAALDSDGVEDRESAIEPRRCERIEVDPARFERCAFESAQCRAKLFVRTAIYAPTNRPKKCVKRERDDTVIGAVRFVVATKQLDVDVLVEGARDTVAGRRETRQRPPDSGA